MDVIVSLLDSATASVFIARTAFGHNFPVHEEENNEYKHWEKCSDDQRDLGLPHENLNVSSQEVFSFGDLMQCHVDRVVLPVHGAQWLVAIDLCVELPWVLSPHSILPSFFPLLPVYCHSVQLLERQFLFPLLRWLFWVTFNIFFSQALNLIK